MFLAFDIGETFIRTLQSIGFFFTSSPLGPFGDFLMNYAEDISGQSWIVDLLIAVSSLSLGELLFGGTLALFVIARLWKFCLELIPGLG